MKYLWFKRAISVATVTATVMGGVVTIPAAINAEEEFPARFDLREEGYVTPVKFQNPWQACWAFSGTAAAESSILSLLGMTNEQYKEAYGGEDFDLSERHLAWFGEYPITALTDPAQAGEGLYTFGIETNPQQVYDNGGFNLVVSSLFSSGVGPVFESLFPYHGAEKLTSVQYAEKYPEKVLPAAISDLEASLFHGRSFDEVYHELKAQDYPFDENTPEWLRKIDDQGFFEGYTNLADITEEQFQDICFSYYMDVQKRTTGNSFYSGSDDWTIPDVNEQGDSNRDIYVGFTLTDGNTLPDLGLLDENGKWTGINHEGMNAVKSELMKGHGVSIAFCADTSKPGEAETGKYINLDTWAHYTYTEDQQNHAVCIVGWDDNYSADHFNEGHRPPGDGAWIVKNSWGSETDWYDNGTGGTINKNRWGVKNEQGQHTGYFYLSYYDKTVMNPETFVFDCDLGRDDGIFSVWSHDYMPSISSFDEDTSVYATDVIKTANVFKNETDKPQKLSSVSTRTSSPDASVEYSIYRVDDNTTDPEGGTLLGRKNATYDYKGFHREKLDGSIVIMPGESFSIVAEESAIIDGQKKYGCNVNSGGDEELSRQMGAPSYCAAVVNPGESFYYYAGKWADWTQVIPDLKASIENGEHYVIDNFSIKAYMSEASVEDQAHAYDVVQIEGVDQDGKATTISGFMKDGVPVPYVDVVEYMNKVYDPENVFSLSSQGSGVYEIGNAKGNMIVDTIKDALHSDRIEQFLYNDQKQDPTNTKEYVYEHIIGTDYRADPSALDIDLAEYGIDIIEEDGRVYFPLTTAADLTGVSYSNTVYYGDKLYLNYGSGKPSVHWQGNFDKDIRDAGEIAFTYGELCFLMDNIYGDAPRCILAESIRDNGLDATLESYSEETKQVKELLNSDKTVDLVFGLDILSFMLCDGGHTDFYTDITTDLQEATAYTELRRIVAEEPDDIRAVLLKKWYGYYSGIMETKMKIEEYDSGYDQYQAIFDEQTEEGNRYRYFEYNNTGIFVYTNYNDDVVRYFKKALDIAKAHGMKNFILDDSINGGGSTESCMYMLNAITPDKRDEFYYEGTMTGNATYEKLDYDMDQDGKFEGDSEDFDYDFNYAVLCSQDSYSSGNLLPCLCKEAGIPIIGETSAGGTCNLVLFKMDPGNQYSASAFRTFNYQKGGDVEYGATPDYDITKKNTDGTTDYSDFRNFELLDQIVNNHYGM